MHELPSSGTARALSPWPLVLCLVGLDYFSTLAYLPSIAVEAAGPWAPVAAGAVVLVTFLVALPVYWYIAGRSSDGRGATGLLEDLIPGWRGKIVVLTLLGFAAADFVITRSLSVADAAVHLINNPHSQRVLERLPDALPSDDRPWWPPLDRLLMRLADPQVAVALGLSVVSFTLLHVFKRGLSRPMLLLAAGAVIGYLALTGLVIGSGANYLVQHPGIWHAWRDSTFASSSSAATGGGASAYGWLWGCFHAALWSFPQMALGLSGFEMIMTVAPQVRPGRSVDLADAAAATAGRARNTRKLMVAAASIMAVYLVSAVTVTALLTPADALQAGGLAEHRALAYLAHGSPLADGSAGRALNPLFGEQFGDLYDFSTILVLCLAGASVSMGLRNLLPHYLNRLGMEVSWAGRVGAILHVLNVIVLLVTVVFRASPASQQWAYATSVLVLLAGGALAATKDLARRPGFSYRRVPRLVLFAGGGAFFLTMTGLTVLINHSGLTIASSFVAAILASSFISRWIRSTELRFEGFEFADEATKRRWEELGRGGVKVLAPHRPGLQSLAEKSLALQRDYRIDPSTPVLFIEAELGDPSNFYQQPLMRIERDGALEVIRVSRCVSVSHVLAAICIEMCAGGGVPPEIIFGWSSEPPLAANLNFLLLGEGNIPWMVNAMVRKALRDAPRQPRILIG
jgi:hypothetical protein